MGRVVKLWIAQKRLNFCIELIRVNFPYRFVRIIVHTNLGPRLVHHASFAVLMCFSIFLKCGSRWFGQQPFVVLYVCFIARGLYSCCTTSQLHRSLKCLWCAVRMCWPTPVPLCQWILGLTYRQSWDHFLHWLVLLVASRRRLLRTS